MHADNLLLPSALPQSQHRQFPGCPPPASECQWYSAPAAAWREPLDPQPQPAANSFYAHEESNASRFFVPVTQDHAQVAAYDSVRCRHYDSLPYAHTTASFSANYSSPASLYYAEYYHSTRRPDQMHSYEMTDAAAGIEKFSFEDFEVLHAGDILALESPLPPASLKHSAATKKWPDVPHSVADISSESMCTHSDSSCDEYIVTSLDDSSTSSGAAVTYCPVENWSSSDILFHDGMGRSCMSDAGYMQVQPGAEAGIKLEAGE